MKRTIALVAIIFAVFGLGFGYVQTLKTQTLKPVKQIIKLKKQNEPEIVLDTYINEKYGYSVKFPKEWTTTAWDIEQAAKLTSIPNGSIWQQAIFEGADGKFEVLVWENSNKAPTQNWLSWFRHEDLKISDIPDEPNSTISDIPVFYFVQLETGRKKPLEYYFFGNGTYMYELVFERDDLDTKSNTDSISENPIYTQIKDSFILLNTLPRTDYE